MAITVPIELKLSDLIVLDHFGKLGGIEGAEEALAAFKDQDLSLKVTKEALDRGSIQVPEPYQTTMINPRKLKEEHPRNQRLHDATARAKDIVAERVAKALENLDENG